MLANLKDDTIELKLWATHLKIFKAAFREIALYIKRVGINLTKFL